MYKLYDRNDEQPINLTGDLLELLSYNRDIRWEATCSGVKITMSGQTKYDSHLIVVETTDEQYHYILRVLQPRKDMVDVMPIWSALYDVVLATIEDDMDCEKAYNYIREFIVTEQPALKEQMLLTPDYILLYKSPIKGAKVPGKGGKRTDK